MVLRIAEEIDSGKSFEYIKSNIEAWKKKSHLLVSSQTLKYMIRSGRVSAVKGFFGKLLGVKPIVVVNTEGKTELYGKPTSTRQAMKMIIDETAKLMDGNKLWGYSISHAKNPEGAEWYAREMEAITGQKPRFINSASPVLGTHVGPGVVALAILLD